MSLAPSAEEEETNELSFTIQDESLLNENLASALSSALELTRSTDGPHDATLTAFERALGATTSRPQLLDNRLSFLCEELMGPLLKEETSELQSDACCRALYVVCKIRGAKTVALRFPRAVEHARRALALLESTRLGKRAWETRYISILWCAMISLIPFDLNQAADVEYDVVSFVYEECVRSLGDSSACREAAAFCLARLLCRRDAQGKATEFFAFASDTLSTQQRATPNAACLRIGVLQALAARLRQGDSASLSDFHNEMLALALAVFSDPSISSFSLERKLAMKCVSRVGVAVLARPIEEVGETIEKIVSLLLAGLRDRETVVRWSSAKGIARTIERISDPALCDQVVVFVREMCVEDESESAWHGACLALAEVARKSRLEAERIEDIVTSCVLPGLAFDRVRGSGSVGSNVRDAACYLAWALARSCTRDTPMKLAIQDFAPLIARSLIVTSCLDREVNVRRAASAAYQELAGRLGQTCLPLGIQVVQSMDFAGVGDIKRSYASIASFLCTLGDDALVHSLVEHLTHVKSKHWDSQLRALSAASLESIFQSRGAAELDATWGVFIDRISQKNTSAEVKHGALLACTGLAKSGFRRAKSQDALSVELDRVLGLLDGCLVLGRTTDMLVEASCCLLGSVCDWFEALSPEQSDSALELVERIVRSHQHNNGGTLGNAPASLAGTLEILLKISPVESVHAHVTKWFAADPKDNAELEEEWKIFLLGESYRFVQDAETKAAIGSFVVAVADLKIASSTLSRRKLGLRLLAINSQEVFASICLTKATNDYSTDRRGDVGSTTRILGAELIEVYFSAHPERLSAHFESIVRVLVRLATERLDSVRVKAAHALRWLARLETSTILSGVASAYEAAFSDVETVQSASNRFADALLNELPFARPEAIHGLTLSAGAIAPSATALASLVGFAQVDEAHASELADGLLACARSALQREGRVLDRIATPALKALASLLESTNGALTSTSRTWCAVMVQTVRALLKNTSSTARLRHGARCLVHLGGAWNLDEGWLAYAEILGSEYPTSRAEASDVFLLWAAGIADPEEDLSNGVTNEAFETACERVTEIGVSRDNRETAESLREFLAALVPNRDHVSNSEIWLLSERANEATLAAAAATRGAKGFDYADLVENMT